MHRHSAHYPIMYKINNHIISNLVSTHDVTDPNNLLPEIVYIIIDVIRGQEKIHIFVNSIHSSLRSKC